MPEPATRPERDAGTEAEASEVGPHAFWSGTLTFGLVSIPVDLFTAQRSSRIRLHMTDEHGTPLRRVYVCPRDDREVGSDELVRGYEIEKGRFVRVSDEELEALEPERSRDIHLVRFVPRATLPPSHFRRGYYLAPSGQSTRAYAVLAQTMERTDRAGIATFVMRGKEYLVAILARGGVLFAETLRFADELRTPEDVGLEPIAAPSAKAVREMEAAIERRASDAIPLEPFHDERSDAMEALARAKLERGEGVVAAKALTEGDEEEEGAWEPPDLIAVLKKRLAAGGEETPRAASARAAQGRARAQDDLEQRSRSELYERAKALDLEGRSKMTRDELVAAIRRAAGSSR